MKKAIISFLLTAAAAFTLAQNQPKIDLDGLTKKASEGDVMAQARLSEIYRRGEAGVPKDYFASLRWANLAASKANPMGIYNLAVLYENGQGVKKDTKRAKELFKKVFPMLKKLAEAGNPRAQYDLGYMYFHGSGGINTDHKKAIDWFEKSANQNNENACFVLGYLYSNGLAGLHKNPATAQKWFRKAALLGNSASQYYLGISLIMSATKGQPPSKEAVKWLVKAAENGEPNAQYIVGGMCETGHGMKRNIAKAAEWYHRAALQGHESAAARLKKLSINMASKASNNLPAKPAKKE
jgi:TPR repeat protein